MLFIASLNRLVTTLLGTFTTSLGPVRNDKIEYRLARKEQNLLQRKFIGEQQLRTEQMSTINRKQHRHDKIALSAKGP